MTQPGRAHRPNMMSNPAQLTTPFHPDTFASGAIGTPLGSSMDSNLSTTAAAPISTTTLPHNPLFHFAFPPGEQAFFGQSDFQTQALNLLMNKEDEGDSDGEEPIYLGLELFEGRVASGVTEAVPGIGLASGFGSINPMPSMDNGPFYLPFLGPPNHGPLAHETLMIDGGVTVGSLYNHPHLQSPFGMASPTSPTHGYLPPGGGPMLSRSMTTTPHFLNDYNPGFSHPAGPPSLYGMSSFPSYPTIPPPMVPGSNPHMFSPASTPRLSSNQPAPGPAPSSEVEHIPYPESDQSDTESVDDTPSANQCTVPVPDTLGKPLMAPVLFNHIPPLQPASQTNRPDLSTSGPKVALAGATTPVETILSPSGLPMTLQRPRPTTNQAPQPAPQLADFTSSFSVVSATSNQPTSLPNYTLANSTVPAALSNTASALGLVPSPSKIDIPRPLPTALSSSGSLTSNPPESNADVSVPRSNLPDSSPGKPLRAPITSAPYSARRKSANANKMAKVFACPFPDCEKTFTKSSSAKSHEMTHSDKRPFVCPYCPRLFGRNHDLQRHRNTHNDFKPYFCDRCDVRFTRNDAMRRHQRNNPDCGQRKANRLASSLGQP
ncbi:hypothetical protein H4R33_001750 [Dimargaris cristalligena]|nr:hypothetical protein H4R33_001750 [Dimargaris cristalligena]